MKFLPTPPEKIDSERFRRWLEEVQVHINRRATFYSVTQGACSGSGETDIFSSTIERNYLDHIGDSIEFMAAGTYANTANNKQIRVYLGSTVVFDSGALAITGAQDWCVRGELIRVTSTSQKIATIHVSSDSTLQALSDYKTATENLATDLTFKLTAQGGASNDIVGQMWKGYFHST